MPENSGAVAGCAQLFSCCSQIERLKKTRLQSCSAAESDKSHPHKICVLKCITTSAKLRARGEGKPATTRRRCLDMFRFYRYCCAQEQQVNQWLGNLSPCEVLANVPALVALVKVAFFDSTRNIQHYMRRCNHQLVRAAQLTAGEHGMDSLGVSRSTFRVRRTGD